MSVSLLTNNTPFLKANLFLETNLSLEALGKIVSGRIFPGIVLSGKNDHIRDDVSAIYFKGLLGCMVVLQEEKKGFYHLSVEPNDFPHSKLKENGQKVCICDISGLLAYLLEGIKEIAIEID